MNNSKNTLLRKDTELLLVEIEDLKKQLNYERQHKHWEELAMIFHDALWQELKPAHNVRAE